MTRRILLTLSLATLLVSGSAQIPKGTGAVELIGGSDAKAISPDGKWQLVVPKSKPRVFPWLTLQATGNPDDQEQRWPLQGNACYVLWRPDSKAFAVTDAVSANGTLIRVFPTDFRLEGDVLGAPVTDLSVPLEKSFRQLAARYYAPKEYDLLLFQPRALRWLGNNELLVGLDARTYQLTGRSGPPLGLREWSVGFIMSPAKREVIRELDDAATRREFGIDLQAEKW